MRSIFRITRLLTLLAAVSYSALSSAQYSFGRIEFSLSSVESTLQSLDELAGQCLQDNPDSCRFFITAIDGKLLASYLDKCQILDDAKQQILQAAINGSVDDSSEDAQIQLQQVARIEKFCADDAVRGNTRYVFAAFSKLQEQQNPPEILQSLATEIAEIEFTRVEQRERDALQSSFRQEQLRRQRETQRQIDQQRIDQISRPFD